MSDFDDDSVVRYGTQLEPYEEDRTCAMPKTKTKLTGSEKKKIKKLLAANVNYNKAREVCHLSWPQICEIIPGIEHIAPDIPLNPPKKCNRKHPEVRVRPIEHLSREFEPDQAPFWRNPYDARVARRTSQDRGTSPDYWKAARRNNPSPCRNEYETDQESLHQPYRPPQTYTKEVLHTSDLKYWEEAGISQERAYEPNRRKRRSSEREPHWKPTYKVAKSSHVDFGETNYWERDRSPPRSRHESPMNCRSYNSYERTKLKYSDTDTLQVKVQDGMRAVNRHYIDSSDEKPFSDQSYKAEKTSSKDRASLYWPEPERPSRLGLRNETHPPKRAHTYSYSEDKKFNASKYQNSSWESSVEYRYSDRPLREGLRNETQALTTICIDDDSDEEYKGRTYAPRTTVDEGYGHFDFREPDRRETKGYHSHWDQPSENHETFEDNGAYVNKDAEPICVGVHNITPMNKQEMMLVHQSINQAIARIGLQGAGPKFSGSIYKTGWILMNCENHMSRKWLEKKVPSLKPWPEANLSILLQDELPLKSIMVSILILDKEGVTVETALELLRVQNPGLNTVNWKVFKVSKTYSGQIVFLSVDEASFEVLRLLNFKANLGINKVSFWVKSGPGKRDGFVNPSAEDVPLASSSAYIERESNSMSCAGENTTKKVSRKKRRMLRIQNFSPLTGKDNIDKKPSLLGPGPSLPQAQESNSRQSKKRWFGLCGEVLIGGLSK